MRVGNQSDSIHAPTELFAVEPDRQFRFVDPDAETSMNPVAAG